MSREVSRIPVHAIVIQENRNRRPRKRADLLGQIRSSKSGLSFCYCLVITDIVEDLKNSLFSLALKEKYM